MKTPSYSKHLVGAGHAFVQSILQMVNCLQDRLAVVKSPPLGKGKEAPHWQASKAANRLPAVPSAHMLMVELWLTMLLTESEGQRGM